MYPHNPIPHYLNTNLNPITTGSLIHPKSLEFSCDPPNRKNMFPTTTQAFTTTQEPLASRHQLVMTTIWESCHMVSALILLLKPETDHPGCISIVYRDFLSLSTFLHLHWCKWTGLNQTHASRGNEAKRPFKDTRDAAFDFVSSYGLYISEDNGSRSLKIWYWKNSQYYNFWWHSWQIRAAFMCHQYGSTL